MTAGFSGRRPLGMVTPLAIALVVLVFIYFMTTFAATRSQSGTARRFTEATAAVFLAEGALAELERLLEHERVPPPHLADLYRDLLAGAAGAIDGRELPVPVGPQAQQILQELADQPIFHRDVSLQLSVRCNGLRGIPVPAQCPGLLADPAEKEGTIRLQARARCGNETRVINVLRRIKVVSVIHPVLSRFSLFVRRPPSDPNRFNLLLQHHARLQANPDSHRLADGAEARPLVFDHGTRIPVWSGGRWDFAAARAQTPSALGQAGLVFLGNGEWTLISAEGRGNGRYSERFTLRAHEYHLSNPVDLFKLAWGAVPVGAPNPGLDRYLVETLGFNADMEFADGSVTPLDQVQALQFWFRERGLTGPLPSSGLRLWGVREAFSPTVVLGDVKRQYFQLGKIDCTMQGQRFEKVTLPYLTDAIWARVANQEAFPQESAKTRRTLAGLHRVLGLHPDNQSVLWPGYRDMMSKVVRENANRVLDFIGTSHEDGPDQAPERESRTDPVPVDGAVWRSGPVIDAVTRNGIQFDPVREPQVWLAKNLTLTAPDQSVVFKGDLHRTTGLPELLGKAVLIFDGPADFWRMANEAGDGQTSIPGVAFIKGRDPFLIKDPLTVRQGHGGIIVTESDIVIANRINAQGEPLTLCSGRGIVVSTDQPIQAALICMTDPNGVLRKSPGIDGFTVQGPVAVDTLDLASIVRGVQPKTVTYSQVFRQHLETGSPPAERWFPRRIYLSPARQVYFSPNDA